MTTWRRSRMGARALTTATASATAALVASQALAAPAEQPSQVTRSAIHVDYGRDVIVRGTAPASSAGHTILLQFAGPGQSGWRQVSSATIGAGGQFRVAGALTQSGLVRAVDVASGALTPFVARASTGRGSTGGAAPTGVPARVDVAARIRMPRRQIDVLGAQAIEIRGRLLPARRGRKVSLQALRDGHWLTLAGARTRSAGRFALRFLAAGAGQQQIRVRFGGDRLNGRSTVAAGRITVYRQAGASWYDDGGHTACGFHAHYGVANRTLPCGTRVAFRQGGRTVTATVDDRGPFVDGRDWDLNQNTASALGFGGVGTVWSSQ